MTTSVILKNVRLSYLYAWKPRKNDKGEESFQASLILPKDHPQVSEVQKAIADEIKAKWPEPKKRPSGLHNPLRDGDKDRENDPAYANAYFINSNAKKDRPPKLIDAQLQDVPDNGFWGSGDYANVKIDLYPFERPENKGIGVGLITIQFKKKGEPLGNRTDPMEGMTVEEDTDDIFG